MYRHAIMIRSHRWTMNKMTKMKVTPAKTTVNAIAQMRSRTAAASIQSFFISSSLSASWLCSFSLSLRVFSRSRISFNSSFTESVPVVGLDGVESSCSIRRLLHLSPVATCWVFMLGTGSTEGDGGRFMQRHAANFLQKRFFICNMKN